MSPTCCGYRESKFNCTTTVDNTGEICFDCQKSMTAMLKKRESRRKTLYSNDDVVCSVPPLTASRHVKRWARKEKPASKQSIEADLLKRLVAKSRAELAKKQQKKAVRRQQKAAMKREIKATRDIAAEIRDNVDKLLSEMRRSAGSMPILPTDDGLDMYNGNPVKTLDHMSIEAIEYDIEPIVLFSDAPICFYPNVTE
jgi:2-succinyl-5-enolpyruvyl-6-hydroxy-3-cyclohexene-1-carboxylate synthase